MSPQNEISFEKNDNLPKLEVFDEFRIKNEIGISNFYVPLLQYHRRGEISIISVPVVEPFIKKQIESFKNGMVNEKLDYFVQSTIKKTLRSGSLRRLST